MTIGAEYRLLIAAASPDPERISAADPAEVDWDVAVQLAADHRLLELLGRYTRATGVQVPDALATELTTARQRTAARELLARRQLIDISRVLADAGIRVAALKGAGLIEQVYSEPGLRPMVDLDLLVAGDDMDRSVEVLNAAGYRPPDNSGDGWSVCAPPEHTHHQVPLVHVEHPFSVELHHQITDLCAPASTERMLHRAQAGSHGAYLLPHPNDQVISLAAHYSLDRQFGSRNALGQLADLAHTLARYPPDWTGVVRDAHAYELSVRVFLALDALNVLGLATVPTHVLEALAPPGWSDALARRMVAKRVLVGAPARTLAGGLPPTLRQALLPGQEFMRARYGLPDASLPRLYLERVRASASILGAAVRHPARFVADATLDRWLRRHADG